MGAPSVADKNEARAHPESPPNDVRLATTLGMPLKKDGPGTAGGTTHVAAPVPTAAVPVAFGSTLVPAPVANNPGNRIGRTALASPVPSELLRPDTDTKETLVQPRSVAHKSSQRLHNLETACSGCTRFPFLSSSK